VLRDELYRARRATEEQEAREDAERRSQREPGENQPPDGTLAIHCA
jgi:hypothetical protein